jgi:hypothetical protein
MLIYPSSFRPQREKCNLGTHVVAQAKTETDALVDVQRTVLNLVHSCGEAFCLAAQCNAAESGKVNLTSVGMAAEHQVAAAVAKVIYGARVVGQDQARFVVAGPGVGLFDVANSAPQVFETSQVHRLAASRESNRLISQNTDAVDRQGIGHCLVEAGVAANAQRTPHREIVVAKYRKHTFGRLQAPQDSGYTVDVFEPLVNEIACKYDEVGILSLSEVNRFSEVSRRHQAAAVEVS